MEVYVMVSFSTSSNQEIKFKTPVKRNHPSMYYTQDDFPVTFIFEEVLKDKDLTLKIKLFCCCDKDIVISHVCILPSELSLQIHSDRKPSHSVYCNFVGPFQWVKGSLEFLLQIWRKNYSSTTWTQVFTTITIVTTTTTINTTVE